MLKDYPILEGLLSSGYTGDRDSFRANFDLMTRRASELGDSGVAELLRKVAQGAEKGRFEDKTNEENKRAAFGRKLGSLDDIPGGLMLVKTGVSMDHVILPASVKEVISDFLSEQEHNEKYLDAGIDPRNKAMLIGPPGNGKTQVTKAIANFMDCPLYFVRYDDLVSKAQGETSKRLDKVFRFAKSHRCILFFDEIDAIAKDRSDDTQTGEMKSVVSTLLVQLDDVPPHVMCLGATNHPEMIDKAMWRRFQVRVSLPNPGIDEIVKYLAMAFGRFGLRPETSLRVLAYRLEAENFAEVEVFVDNCVRAWVRQDKAIRIEDAIEYAVVRWPKDRVKMAT
jgi:SpoVK/Ycf46/Vps4 family AAA+-type ATPase